KWSGGRPQAGRPRPRPTAWRGDGRPACRPAAVRHTAGGPARGHGPVATGGPPVARPRFATPRAGPPAATAPWRRAARLSPGRGSPHRRRAARGHGPVATGGPPVAWPRPIPFSLPPGPAARFRPCRAPLPTAAVAPVAPPGP